MRLFIKNHLAPKIIKRFYYPKPLLFSTGILGLYYVDTEFNAKAIRRNIRTLWNGVCITWDYKMNFVPDADISAIHQRTADRILYTCQENGGLYVKFGQGVATMNHILPDQYNQTLKSLFMEAPHLPFDRVIKLFHEEFGKHPDDVFIDFDREPIASASIAQVHRAKLQDGTPVAVKVQKDYVKKQMFWDMLCYRILLFAFETAFELPLLWSAEYTERHLRQELDFLNEGRNSELAAEQFRADPTLSQDVYIPKVHWDYSTKRVLTTEWIDGIPLADPNALTKAGFSLENVMATTVSAFSYQIFQTGLVHSDPHIGNILVRRKPGSNSKTEVCILDHGLYMRESEEFRSQYCLFWKYLFLMDMTNLKKIASDWGIEDVDIFAQATLQRPYSSSKAVHLGPETLTKQDLYRMQMVTKERIRRFLSDTEKIPRELIFVGRTLNIIRSNNKHLGSPVNRVNIMANWAIKGLGGDWETQVSHGRMKELQTYFKSRVEYFIFQSQLFLISLSFYSTRFLQKIIYFFTGKRIWGFEDLMEQQIGLALKDNLGIDVRIENFKA